MAAGVAFYSFLSFVPLLGALIMTYGLIADPALVANHLKVIIDLVPADAARLIYEQLVDLTTAAGEKKGFGLIIALGVSIYGATRASGAVMSALNVLYEQEDTRGIIKGTAIAALLIVGAFVIGIAGILGASAMGFVRELAHDQGSVAEVGR